MTTTKSYSNKSSLDAIYRSSLKQQLSFGIVTTIVLFFALVIPFIIWFTDFESSTNVMPTPVGVFSGIYFTLAHVGAIQAILGALAVMCALVTSNYLHSKSMVDMYHAIPVKRSTLFTANFLATMTVIFTPFFVIVASMMAIQKILLGNSPVFAPDFLAINVMSLMISLIYIAVLYVFTMLIAVHVGTSFDTFSITAETGVMGLITYGIIGIIWQSLVYGASFTAKNILLLSPFTFAFDWLTYKDNVTGLIDFGKATILLCLSAVVLVGLYLFTIKCYNRRKSELAEQTLAYGTLQTIVKCFAAFLGAMVFYGIFNSFSIIARYFMMIVGAVLVGIIAELIYSRGLKGIKRNILWLLATGIASVILVIVIGADFVGFSKRVPAFDNVASVKTSYVGIADNHGYIPATARQPLTQPDSIATIVESHRLIAENPPQAFGLQALMLYSGNEETHDYTMFEIEYTLKNGSKSTRRYDYSYAPAILNFVKLNTQEDFLSSFNTFRMANLAESDLPTNASVHTSDRFGNGSNESKQLGQKQLHALLLAIKEDTLAQNISDLTNPTQPAQGSITIIPDGQWMQKTAKDVVYKSGMQTHFTSERYEPVNMLVTPQHVKTIEMLKQLGIYEQMTQPVNIIKRVYLSGLTQSGVQLDQIFTSTSNGYRMNVGEFYQNGDNIDVNLDQYGQAYKKPLEVTDQKLVVEIMAKSQNQLLITRDNVQQLVLASYYSQENGQVGIQVVNIANLPQSLQAQATDIAKTENQSVVG